MLQEKDWPTNGCSGRPVAAAEHRRWVRGKKMTERKMFDLVLKVFGIYLLTVFIKTIPMTLMQFFINLPSDMFPNPAAYLSLNILHSLLPLVIAALFLFKSDAITACLVKQVERQSETGTMQPVFATLWFWIRVIGVYFCVSSAPAVLGFIVENVGDFTMKPSTHVTVSHIGRGFWSQLFTLAFSLVLIFRSKSVERFIQRVETRNTQPEN